MQISTASLQKFNDAQLEDMSIRIMELMDGDKGFNHYPEFTLIVQQMLFDIRRRELLRKTNYSNPFIEPTERKLFIGEDIVLYRASAMV